MRMLIIEDCKDNAELLKTYMEMHRHNVHIAQDASHAIPLIRENIYDVVILDHCLPGTDGLEFLKKLRHVGFRETDTNCRRVPVVIATAVDAVKADEIRSEVESLQPAGVIRKPFAPEDLLKEINEVRNPRRQPS